MQIVRIKSLSVGAECSVGSSILAITLSRAAQVIATCCGVGFPAVPARLPAPPTRASPASAYLPLRGHRETLDRYRRPAHVAGQPFLRRALIRFHPDARVLVVIRY